MGVLVRVLAERYTPQELSVYRNVIGAVPSLVLMWWTGELATISRRTLVIPRWGLALFRGVLVAVAQLFWYVSLTKMPFAAVAALGQTGAIFLVALSVPLLGERVGAWRWGAVLFGFGGALLIIRPGTEAFTPFALLPLGAALCYSSSGLLVRKFPSSVSTPLLYLYSSIASAIAAVAFALWVGPFTPITGFADAFWIVAMSLAGGIGVLLLLVSYRIVAPSVLAPFNYFGLLTSFLVGWVVFAEFPVDTLFPGVLFILCAGLVILWRENRLRAEA